MFGGKIYVHLPGARAWMTKRLRRRAPLRVPADARPHRDERVIGILADTIDQIESEQAIEPRPSLEAIADNVRYARNELVRSHAAELSALEDFARDHPVGEPFDPDRYDVEGDEQNPEP